MTNSTIHKAVDIATAIHDAFIADGWTTPESDREGNRQYHRVFSKEGYANITQDYALDNPEAWRSYVTSLTLECDKKLIRCVAYCKPKQLRAFLVRADKLQIVARDKQKHDDARKAESKKRQAYIDEYMKLHSTYSWKDYQDVVEGYDTEMKDLKSLIATTNIKYGFAGEETWHDRLLVKMTYPNPPCRYGGRLSTEKQTNYLNDYFKIEVSRYKLTASEAIKLSKLIADLVESTESWVSTLKARWMGACNMSVAIHEVEVAGDEAYRKAKGVA